MWVYRPRTLKYLLSGSLHANFVDPVWGSLSLYTFQEQAFPFHSYDHQVLYIAVHISPEPQAQITDDQWDSSTRMVQETAKPSMPTQSLFSCALKLDLLSVFPSSEKITTVYLITQIRNLGFLILSFPSLISQSVPGAVDSIL